MSLKRREIEDVLTGKFGFEEISSTRGGHPRFAFYHNGKKIASTGFSHAFRRNTDIGPGLLGRMAKEVRVETQNFFRGMIECQNSLNDFIEQLRQLGYISDE